MALLRKGHHLIFRMAAPCAIGLLVLFPGVSFAQAPTVSLLPATNFPVTGAPVSVATGDFHGDGTLDLAVASWTNPAVLGQAGTVNIMLGNGTGGFVAPLTLSGTIKVGQSSSSVVVADFNRDGHADVAVAGGYDGTVVVWIGNGDGTFGPAVTYDANGSEVTSLAVGDVNGDGKLDLVTANYNGSPVGTVAVLLGNGDGTFGPPTLFVFPPSFFSSYAVSLGDLNGDGKLDIAVATNSNAVVVLLGNGDGTFGSPTAYSYPGNGGNGNVAIGDLNGDEKLDLVAANIFDNSVAVLLGNGDGTFGTATRITVGSAPNFVGISDLNGDGFMDLVVANASGSSLTVLMGNCAGSLTPASGSPFVVGTGPVSGVIEDLNRDGKPDLVSANATSHDVSVLLNTTFNPFITCISPTSGPVGTTVTITGSNFGATEGSSTVKFNGATAAAATTWTNTQIVVNVPS